MPDLLTISEVSRRSGVAASALRFYEERGLIESERGGSGHRRYPRAALRRIAFIVFAQRMGLTLEEVGAELAKLPENREPDQAGWAKIPTTSRKAAWRRGSPNCSASRRVSSNASAAAACRFATAISPIPTIARAG